MTESERETLFRAVLQSRGWILENHVQAPGMMAGTRASLGFVFRNSDGAPGFAKCIWEATPSTGISTHQLAGPDRLARLHKRLRRLASRTDIPIVQLLDVATIPVPACLLVVMGRVRPIGDTLDGSPNDALAGRILRRFSPRTDWTHFDICPANSGVTASGEPVLIDVESVYLVDEPSEFEVSCLAAKWFRAPGAFCDDANKLINARAPIRSLALSKHVYEVLLLAAEVSLGQQFTHRIGDRRAEDWLLIWLAEMEQRGVARDRVSFWRSHLIGAFAPEKSPNLDSVADDLARELSPATRPPDVEPISESSVFTNHRAAAMRRDRLGQRELEDYLADLLANGRTTPMAAGYWYEACILLVCYLKDQVRAVSVVGEALEHHPHDSQLKQWAAMIRLWASNEGTRHD